jgi:tetratricopeptide (TPR) repeat protein
VHDPAAITLAPGPLSPAGAAALVRERLGAEADDAFCAACHEGTGGNPLLLRQLLRALEAEGVRPDAAHIDVVRAVGPRAASSTVLLRLGRLPGEAVRVARAVSVLGEHAELPAVAALAGLDEAAVAAATGELARSEILRPDPPLGFVHPLVRDAVYRELPPGERALLHERAAKLLRDAGAPAEQVAAQLLAAPRRGAAWVVDALETAGATAIHRGAADSAVATLRRALEDPPAPERRPGVLLALGTAEALTSGPAAADHLQAAYEEIDDPVGRAQVADGLARVLLFTGRPEDAAAIARRARAELPPDASLRDSLEALDLATLYIGPLQAERLGDVAAHRHAGAPPALLAVTAVDWAHRGGSADAACALAAEALERGRLAETETGLFAISAILTLALADRDDAVAALDAAVAAAHRDGSLFGIASIHLFYGIVLLWRGDLAGAHEMLTTGKGEFDDWGFAQAGQAYLDAHLARVATERGELAARSRRARWRSARPTRTATSSTRRSSWRSRRAAGRRRWRPASGSRPRSVSTPAPPPGAGAPRWRSRSTGLAGARRRSPAPAWSSTPRGRGARRASSGTRCACSARSKATWDGWRRRSPHSRARPPGSTSTRRWPRWARRCGASGARPRRASRCAARSSSRPRATRRGWPSGSGPSSTRPVPGRAPTPSPARPR